MVPTSSAPTTVGSDGSHCTPDSIEMVARRNCTILIIGETGAGKEVTARRVHALSPRARAPFMPVDCTGLRDELMESQLFGHERGAFTGADRSTVGFFRSADKGTLFLDEIGELSLPLQAKLLRVIQERRVTPLGGVTSIPVDVRIICATHRDLWKMAREGRFRADLLYRLDVVRLEVAPLRLRREEIPLLVEDFLATLADEYDGEEIGISGEALNLLCAHDWPGNVRELRNAVERAYIFADAGVILPEHLPEAIRRERAAPQFERGPVPSLAESERSALAAALTHARGNRSKAAHWLGIDRRRLARRLAAHGLTGE